MFARPDKDGLAVDVFPNEPAGTSRCCPRPPCVRVRLLRYLRQPIDPPGGVDFVFVFHVAKSYATIAKQYGFDIEEILVAAARALGARHEPERATGPSRVESLVELHRFWGEWAGELIAVVSTWMCSMD